MANISLKNKNIDWAAIEAQTHSGKKSTGMVDVIRDAARQILASGNAYEIRKLQGMIGIALNQDVENDEDKVVVNWITVKYALTHADGFREIEKNVFVLDSTAKKPTKKGRK